MPKKKLTLTQGIIGFIPTALIVSIMICYNQKIESRHYLDVAGTYFGYLRKDNEEPLLFKLELRSDSLGNYFSFNNSRKRYYVQEESNNEFVIRDKVDSYSSRRKKINLKLTQHRAKNVIEWHESNMITDNDFKEMLFNSESKGTLIKMSDQFDVFPLN